MRKETVDKPFCLLHQRLFCIASKCEIVGFEKICAQPDLSIMENHKSCRANALQLHHHNKQDLYTWPEV